MDVKKDISTVELGHGKILFAKLDKVFNIARGYSIWPLSFGLACCAIEALMAANASRYDLSRFGYEVMRPSPRQADVMIVAGTVTSKMERMLVRLYEQMAAPKWVIAVGSCAISGGPFVDSYHVVPGVDKLIPVDVYVPGCPPRPEAVIEGMLMLRDKIHDPKVVKVASHGN